MKFILFLKYDLISLFNYSKMRLLILALIPLMTAVHYYAQFPDGFPGGITPSALDIYFYFMRGSDFFANEGLSVFDIPIEWLFVQIAIIFALCLYPMHELRSSPSRLVQFSSKKRWWISKICCLSIYIFVFYALCMIVFVVASYALGSQTIALHSTLALYGYGNLNAIDPVEIMPTMLMPLLASWSICILTAFLAILLGPAASLWTLMIYIILSIYYGHSILMTGDNGMLLRNGGVVEGGIPNTALAASCLVFIVLSVIIGYYNLVRLDILGGDDRQ